MSSRNSKYEDKKKAKGLKKITLWGPEHCEVEIKQIVEHCIDDRDCIPFMVRSLTTGRMAKGVD